MADIPKTMRVAVLRGHGGLAELAIDEVRTPMPGPGEVLVRVGAAALNNTDIWTREGAYGLPGAPEAKAGWRGPISFPRIPGGDVAGTVVRVGDGVPDEFSGARVLVDPAIYDRAHPDAQPVGLLGSERDGGYAEYVAVPARRAHRVDESPLSDAELASLPVAYGTALGMLERGHVQADETVLVTGASGGVGFALVQLAAARGARVLAVSSTDKLPAVREAGAVQVIDRREDDVAAAVRAAANDGLDVALDVVAGDLVPRLLPLLRDGGRWVVAGALAGYDIALDIRRLYLHNIALVGSSMHTPTHFDLLVDIARRGAVRPAVAATYPLTEARRAQADLATRNHVGKLVLLPQGR